MADLIRILSIRRIVATLSILVAVFIGTTVGAQDSEETSYAPFPEPGPGYVTDIAGLLSDAQEQRIERRLKGVQEQTGVEIVVVLIGSTGDYLEAPQNSIEAFAMGLFDAYGIGDLPEDDGVLLLVARDDREARIELGKGHGLYRNRDASRIMQQEIVPAFKRGDYAGGVEAGVNALMLEFAGVRVGVNWPMVWLICSAPVLGLIAFSLFKSGQRGWGWVVVGILIVVVLMLTRAVIRILIAIKNAESSDSSDSGWSGGSWSSGGSSSSSGGGFGGGSSGGGGATGRW